MVIFLIAMIACVLSFAFGVCVGLVVHSEFIKQIREERGDDRV